MPAYGPIAAARIKALEGERDRLMVALEARGEAMSDSTYRPGIDRYPDRCPVCGHPAHQGMCPRSVYLPRVGDGPVPVGDWRQCTEHGPTVNVEWRSGERCPLCVTYDNERVLRLAMLDIANGLTHDPDKPGRWECGELATEIMEALDQ